MKSRLETTMDVFKINYTNVNGFFDGCNKIFKRKIKFY